MYLLGALVSILFLMDVVVVYSQTQLPTTVSPRDYLFVKRDFVKQRADVNKTRFTAEEKWRILQMHNSYRSLVEPPAKDMRELVWDNDLEDYAWNNTQACTGAHSAGTMIKKWQPDNPDSWRTWMYMGENLYYSYAPWYSYEAAIAMFWAEGAKYDILTSNCTHPQTCGHYRVLVTAISSRIGCALNTCNNFSISKYPTPAIFMACSYDGRYLIYDKPYIVGERGSDCTYDNLGSTFQYARYGLCISHIMEYYKIGFDGNTSIVGLPSPYLTSSTSTFTSDHTTLHTRSTESDTTISTRSTESDTTLSTPSTEGFTTLSTPSTEGFTTLSTYSTENSTQVEVVTSTHPSTSTKQTSRMRTVSYAVRLSVPVSQTLLLAMIYLVV